MALYKPSAQQLALACGAAGAYVEVTDDLVTDTISGAWGRTSGFSDTRPGVFSFDLVNDSGKYTPGNAASSLVTKIRIGMGVHHIVDGMHFGGTIRSVEPYFTGPAALAGSSKVRVTCDDMLGDAARNQLPDVPAVGMVQAAQPYLWWPLSDASGSVLAADNSGNVQASLGPVSGTAPTINFGASGVPGIGLTQLALTDSGLGATFGVAASFTGASAPLVLSPISYDGSGALGTWGVWITPQGGDQGPKLVVIYGNFGPTFNNFQIGLNQVSGALTPVFIPQGGSTVFGSPVPVGVPHFYSVTVAQQTVAGTTSLIATPYFDGVAMSSPVTIGSYVGAAASNRNATPTAVSLVIGSLVAGAQTAQFSNLSLTRYGPTQQQTLLPGVTEASRLSGIASLLSTVVLDTLPSGLSASPLGQADVGGSALDAINSVIRTEQGSVWAETTGALLSPNPKMKVRERARPATVDAAHTLSISEILNAPAFATDIENMVWAATANGPTNSQTASDATLISYVGPASDSTDVLLRDPVDLLAWAQDRLLRGKATDVRLPQFTVDALQVNRWEDISSWRAGDRVRVNLGSLAAQLGVSSIDGWLLGCNYSLQYPSIDGQDDVMLFTFNLQPVLPAGGIYDTSVYDTAVYAF